MFCQLDPIQSSNSYLNLANKCTIYSSIGLKYIQLWSLCQELYLGHIYCKNNPECASVYIKGKRSYWALACLACQLLLTIPEFKVGEVHRSEGRGTQKWRERRLDKTVIPGEICLREKLHFRKSPVPVFQYLQHVTSSLSSASFKHTVWKCGDKCTPTTHSWQKSTNQNILSTGRPVPVLFFSRIHYKKSLAGFNHAHIRSVCQ